MIENKLGIVVGLVGAGMFLNYLCREEEEEKEEEKKYEYYSRNKDNVNYSQTYQEKGFSSSEIIKEEGELVPNPLTFSTMIEPYVESDYNKVTDISKNSGIPVYNANDGSINLPVGDMTDLSSSDENNKYIFDRTLGTIGFTSSKIGNVSRSQADMIRGDLPIIPQNTGWFQVSSNPIDKLVQGAMNLSGNVGISNSTVESKIGLNEPMGVVSVSGQRNAGGPREPTLQDLIEERTKENVGGGGLRAMKSEYARLPQYTVADLQNAQMNQNMKL
jgi:hypothetical protein